MKMYSPSNSKRSEERGLITSMSSTLETTNQSNKLPTDWHLTTNSGFAKKSSRCWNLESSDHRTAPGVLPSLLSQRRMEKEDSPHECVWITASSTPSPSMMPSQSLESTIYWNICPQK